MLNSSLYFNKLTSVFTHVGENTIAALQLSKMYLELYF